MVHLHVHTEYSLLDGAARIEDLVCRAKELGFSSLAITDHGAMYGAVEFYNQCKKHGIKPIIGFEAYVAPGNMTDRGGAMREYAHLILLAKNETGYRNLVKLCSMGFTQGFYYKPRIDYHVLEQHCEGLICLSACLAGDIPSLLLNGRLAEAETLALRLKAMFGEDFYIELQDHGIAEQKQVLPMLVDLAQKLQIPMVATNDLHYTLQEDAEAHDVLLCIQTNQTVDAPGRMRFQTQEFYLKSAQEMQQVFAAYPQAIENTDKIADVCQFDYVFGQVHLPKFDVPQGHTAESYLRLLCGMGLEERYGSPTQQALDRLEYEMDTILKMGYADYFLIVWDFIRFAKEQGIMVGPGRGSAAGSLIAYCLQITDVDPLQYQLLFERFLNPERISMPDIDIDFCYERRGEVIEYVVQKYGEERVAQIITFGTMAARAVLRDVGRALNMPYAQVDRIAKLVPFELGMTLDKAITSQELGAAVQDDETVAKLYALAKRLEGLPRHASTHAAGVVICAGPVTDLVPLQTNDGAVTTQFPMGTLEKLGLLKMDFLGLRTLTVMRDCLAMARACGQNLPDLNDITFDDPGVFDMISKGDTDGVFQLESAGMRRFMQQLVPSNLEDVIAGIALYRPGPMESIPRYIEGKHHPDKIKYLHPIMEQTLSVTYGCMVYQEQVMQIVRDLAGYSLGRSDLVRRAMAKKHRDEMERERDVFIYGLDVDGKTIVPGCVRSGITEGIANQIFDQMTSFAEYAFNKSHATVYAVIAYQTAYLKLHAPVALMAALMNSENGNATKISRYIDYCRKHGIQILPPDINQSVEGFSIEGKSIRFGLAAVRNVGAAAVTGFIKVREKNGPFKSLDDFCLRVETDKLNRRMLESLILSGAFDFMNLPRARMMAGLDSVLSVVQAQKKAAALGQMSLFGGETLDQAPQSAYPNIDEYSLQEKLSREKEMLGIYLFGHPLEEYRPAMEEMSFSTLQIQDEEDLKDGKNITMGGIVLSIKQKVTRGGSTMAFVTVEDLDGQIEMLVFPAVWKRLGDQLVEGKALAIQGKLSLREEESAKILLDEVWPLGQKPPVRPPRQLMYKNDADLRVDEEIFEEPAVAMTQPMPILNEEIGQEESISPKYKNLYIRLPGNCGFEALESAKGILMQYPGNVGVRVHFGDNNSNRTHALDIFCDASDELVQKLSVIYGFENIKRTLLKNQFSS